MHMPLEKTKPFVPFLFAFCRRNSLAQFAGAVRLREISLLRRGRPGFSDFSPDVSGRQQFKTAYRWRHWNGWMAFLTHTRLYALALWCPRIIDSSPDEVHPS